MDKSEAMDRESLASDTALPRRGMTRWQAAGTHLLISAGIGGAVLTLMLLIWYPPPLFQAMGGVGLALILVGVDVVLGPTLTLIVFRSGKPGLKLDLTLIGACQLAALLYGVHVVSLARPAFIVFAKDQFQVATVAALEPAQLEKARYAQFRSPSWGSPVWVFLEMPKDPETLEKLTFLGLQGIDVHLLPEYYAPYEQGRPEILRQAWPLERMRKEEPGAAQVVDAWLKSSRADEKKLRYLRLMGRIGWVAVLVDAATAEPVKMLLTETY